MKRLVTQFATRTIALWREIVVEFPTGIDPVLIDQTRLAALLEEADVDWENDGEKFRIESVEWTNAEGDERCDVVYED